jgi:hypothetical protein
VIAFGGVAGAAVAELLAGATGVCEDPSGAIQHAMTSPSSNLLSVFILTSPLLPNGILYVLFVEQTNNAEQADAQPKNDECKTPAHRTGQRQTKQADQEPEQRHQNSNEN